MPFKTKLVVEHNEDEVGAIVREPLEWEHKDYGTWIVEAGTPTDFASVPWFGTWFVPRVAGTAYGAVLHDDMYGRQGDGKFTRAQCDKAFYIALRETNFPWWRAQMAYRAVRVGGRGAWKGYAEEKENPPDIDGLI